MNKKAQAETIGIIFLAVFAIVTIVCLIGFDYVPAGNVGVKDNLGQVDMNPLQPGVYWTGMTTHTENMNTRIQLRQYDASGASNDLQDIKTKVAVNFKINPSTASKIYKDIGVYYQDIIISPIIQESVKAVTAKFNAEELVTKRTTVKNGITDAITNKLAEKGIDVTEVSITDFEFSKEFTDAIERKQVAQQDALTAVNKLKEMESLSQAMALQSKVIEIKKLDLQQQWITKWDGHLPNVMTGDNQNFMMQIPTEQVTSK